MIRVEILNADGTPVRRRHLSKQRSLWALGKAMLGPVSMAIAIPLAAISIQDRTSASESTGDGSAPFSQSSESGAIAARAAGSTRGVYPCSVVPGGVHSVEEAREAVAGDPVVARHYRDVMIDALRVEPVRSPRAVYVSYRRGNDVYWTKKKLVLHAGETLLSDGVSQVRARCGNRVSEQWQTPVSDVDPPDEALEQAAPIVAPEPVSWPQVAEWTKAAPLTATKLVSEPVVVRRFDADPRAGAPRPLASHATPTGSSALPW
jgi:hypothetical protein